MSMMEFLVLALILYLGLKVAWWLIKTTVLIGVFAVILGVLILPWGLFF